MFFSKENFDSQFSGILPVSRALSFEKVQSSLLAADQLYLMPVLGSQLMATIEGYLAAELSAGHELAAGQRSLLRLARTAEAYLGLFCDFDALQLRITDQGFQRQQTENYGSPYKYQEDRLRHTFQTRGLNAIDQLLDLIEATQPEGYDSMPSCVTTRTDIVQRTREVNAVHFINNSRLVFLRLVPCLMAVERTALQPLIGWRLFTALKQALERDAEGVDGSRWEQLRRACIPFVVKRAVADLIRQTGTLTDRGLYFEAVTAQAGLTAENDTSTPATRREAHDMASIADADAVREADILTSYISTEWSEYFQGRQSDTFKRDNDNRKTFWA
ncbi:MAG: hypothetical protein J5486_04215 [Bacteroidaceae bacterium]|nr:hypothetical protein [Bacteroidaceae bacterium]